MQFHFSKAERQRFSFFLFLAFLSIKEWTRNTFLRARPVKIKYSFGCVPEETLQTKRATDFTSWKKRQMICTKLII